MTSLPPFNESAVCAKCDGDDVGVAFHTPHPPGMGFPGAACPAQEHASVSHELRRCQRCYFAWLEAPGRAESDTHNRLTDRASDLEDLERRIARIERALDIFFGTYMRGKYGQFPFTHCDNPTEPQQSNSQGLSERAAQLYHYLYIDGAEPNREQCRQAIVAALTALIEDCAAIADRAAASDEHNGFHGSAATARNVARIIRELK